MRRQRDSRSRESIKKLSAILPADGAFYLYADVSRFTADSEAFAKAMLKDIGVAVTPGIDFDPERGRSYLRLS